MIPRLPPPPKDLPAAIAERVEEIVEDSGSRKKHHSKDGRQRLLKVFSLGQVQRKPMVVDRVNSAKFWLRPAGEATIIKRNREKKGREESNDADDSYDLGLVFHSPTVPQKARADAATAHCMPRVA
jgi:hypothetical protein